MALALVTSTVSGTTAGLLLIDPLRGLFTLAHFGHCTALVHVHVSVELLAGIGNVEGIPVIIEPFDMIMLSSLECHLHLVALCPQKHLQHNAWPQLLQQPISLCSAV